VATKVISERTNLDVDNVPGDAQISVLEKIGPVFVENGDVPNQQQVDDAIDTIVNDTYAKAADADAIG
jgi:sulfonate transport system substrate-binding protein